MKATPAGTCLQPGQGLTMEAVLINVNCVCAVGEAADMIVFRSYVRSRAAAAAHVQGLALIDSSSRLLQCIDVGVSEAWRRRRVAARIGGAWRRHLCE